MQTTSGEIDFDVPSAGKPCKTWYQIHGDLSAGRPLIVLHGGPGIGHHYLLPLSRLSEVHRIPVVLYDQIGGGNSTHLQEKLGDRSFWTIDLFLDELDNLIRGLGISEYDILGHSWGGMLAAEHAARKPAGLNRLILSSTPASVKLWLDAAYTLRKTLSQDVQDTLAKYELKGDFEASEYQSAIMEFYKRYTCRTDPVAPELVETFAEHAKDRTVYLTVNGGQNEFFVTGVIQDWTIVDRIHLIDSPTLLINGEYDVAQSSAVLPYFERLKNVTWVKFAESSHVAHLEERDKYIRVVGGFLHS